MIDASASVNSGKVFSLRGRVVDVQIGGSLTPFYSVLLAEDEYQMVMEMHSQCDAGNVCGIAIISSLDLARSIARKDSGSPLQAPVGKGILSRLLDVFGDTIGRELVLSDVQRRSAHRVMMYDIIVTIDKAKGKSAVPEC